MAREDKNSYSRRKLRNNGKVIGEVGLYPESIKKTARYAGYVIALGIGFIVGRSSVTPEVNQVVYNTISESYFDEPTYNGIPYEIKSGDTISAIVYSYESDPSKVRKLVEQIEDFNNINANAIRVGEIIYLFGVPSSRLEDFGYTDNYNLYHPTMEIDIRLGFLEQVIDNLSRADGAFDDFIRSYQEVFNDYLDFKHNYLPGDDYLLDDILDRLRVLCEESRQFGYNFEDNLRALPLSEAEITKTNGRGY